jgi:hypothetical protein
MQRCMFFQIAQETILLLINNIHEKIMQSRAWAGHMLPRTQALCVVLWLAWPSRGPRGLI